MNLYYSGTIGNHFYKYQVWYWYQVTKTGQDKPGSDK